MLPAQPGIATSISRRATTTTRELDHTPCDFLFGDGGAALSTCKPWFSFALAAESKGSALADPRLGYEWTIRNNVSMRAVIAAIVIATLIFHTIVVFVTLRWFALFMGQSSGSQRAATL